MSLDLAAIVQGAIAAVPGSLRRTLRFTRTLPGEVDTATDTRVGLTEESFDASVVITTPAASGGQPIDKDERVLILASADAMFKPRAGHTVTSLPPDDDIHWRVIDNDTLDPNGVAALYQVRVRR